MARVRLANLSQSVFSGWTRAVCDSKPKLHAGKIGANRFVVGNRCGLDTYHVDLRVTLTPGEQTVMDLDQAVWVEDRPLELPSDLIGTAPTLGGVPMQLLSQVANGAGHDLHYRARVQMLCADLWVTVYPDQSAFAVGELIITCSNVSLPDLALTLETDLDLRWAGAWVMIPNAKTTHVLSKGEQFGDGQARAFPVLFVWTTGLTLQTDWSSAGALSQLGICANGINSLWPTGNPTAPAAFSPVEWGRYHWEAAKDSLHTWDTFGLGPNKRSGDTGAQEDQVFVGAELSQLGNETINYLAALGMSRRPCHHLEANGDQLDLARHPDLRLWDGRAHWHKGVSPDQLGKPSPLYEAATNGWWGPDVEHWLFNRLAIAARTKGTPALQWLLQAQARVYLLQWTAAPGLSTSSTYAARAPGWEAIGVVHLWRGLADRSLAQAVLDRWKDRMARVIYPNLSEKPSHIWDVRLNDPRLGPGDWWLPWQQSVGAYGLWLAGKVFDNVNARILAILGATRVLEDAWTLGDDGRWVGSPMKPVWTTKPDASFNNYGMPLAVAVVLDADNTHEKARAIWSQLIEDTGGGGKWFPPGMPQ